MTFFLLFGSLYEACDDGICVPHVKVGEYNLFWLK